MSIPAVTAQVISLLYNIVDRIYIGHMGENGAAALTGVGLVMPITTLVHSFALLIASGGSPLLSTELGRNNKKVAEQILGTCAASLLALSVILFHWCSLPNLSAICWLLWSVPLPFLSGFPKFLKKGQKLWMDKRLSSGIQLHAITYCSKK